MYCAQALSRLPGELIVDFSFTQNSEEDLVHLQCRLLLSMDRQFGNAGETSYLSYLCEALFRGLPVQAGLAVDGCA